MSELDGTIRVLASRVRSEERLILDALTAAGAAHEYVDPRVLRTVLDAPAPSGRLVLNREISLVRARYAAHALEAVGCTVVNSFTSIDVCGDKWRTSAALVRSGVPTPRAALALTPEGGIEALRELGYPAVIKPKCGSWGRGVALLKDEETARIALELSTSGSTPDGQVVYLQEAVPKPERDIRVVVVGGRALGAVYRRSKAWRTNVARGAVVEPCPLSPALARVAVAATAAVGAEIAGVDMVEDADGAPTVLEVNGRTEFAGFQRALDGRVDVAATIVDHLLTKEVA
ncbi:[lysine-biosynthesis-protein LysW]--L-2-aminoadipate ligase [Nocardiopsis sp. Huas11]|uniref:RimK family alpha-L-glutamate ligase n=1 Tax=Nocardiopsis sp. Huas11 TaxID=2183912 RepID=UPI000EAD72D7|nr:RimK family alpha-L-glutamate ligase [Nocardiopsis sp. Huas11]RKS08411.1 [lysine-biosynthesis-protein LysW]--L-2-aminoadipate ligase [Nocardiopsis sp. Huas11]